MRLDTIPTCILTRIWSAHVLNMVDMDKKLFESYVEECENRLKNSPAGQSMDYAKALLSGL